MADFTNGYNERYYVENVSDLTRLDNMIMIWGGSGVEPLWGFIDGSSTFGAQANWEAGLIGADVQKSWAAAGSKLTNAFGKQQGFHSARSTMQTWQNSTTDAVAFNIIRLASADKPGSNPLDEVKKGWAYVLPSRARNGDSWFQSLLTIGGGGDLMVTPGGYTVNAAGTQKGQISVNIGNWFRSPNAWIASSAKFEVSKQRVKGTHIPLWAKIDIVLSPSREFFADEVQSWFLT